MVRKITNMLLCLPPRAQVADGDDAMWSAGKIERPRDQLDGYHRPIGVIEIGLDRLVWIGDDPVERRLLGKACCEGGADNLLGAGSSQVNEAVIGGHDEVAVANEQPLNRSIGETAHPVGLDLDAPPLTQVERDGGQCQQDDDETRDPDRARKPFGGQS